MNGRLGAWGEVMGGTMLQGRDGHSAWAVVAERDGWLQVQSGSTGELKSFMRPPPGQPVTILEPTWEEALDTAARTLGAVVIPHRDGSPPNRPQVVRPFP